MIHLEVRRARFEYQRPRFFPLPDYELTPNRVKVTLYGNVLDLEYARYDQTYRSQADPASPVGGTGLAGRRTQKRTVDRAAIDWT